MYFAARHPDDRQPGSETAPPRLKAHIITAVVSQVTNYGIDIEERYLPRP